MSLPKPTSFATRSRWWALALVLAFACAHTVDPRAPKELRSKDVNADGAFAQARHRFSAGEWKLARAEMERFIDLYPEDVLVPYAQVFAGRAAWQMGDTTAAARLLALPSRGSVEQGSTISARYYLGLVEADRGDCLRAVELLGPLESSISPDEESLGLFAALARCQGEKGKPLDGLRYWGRYYAHKSSAPHERAYARLAATELAGKLSDGESYMGFMALERGSLGQAVLGPKALLAARKSLDDDKYRELEQKVAELRNRYSEEENDSGDSGSTPPSQRTLGLLVALSGPTRAASSEMLRGAVMAVGGFMGGGAAKAGQAGDANRGAGIRLLVADTHGDKTRVAEAVGTLESEGAMAIVGPIDRAEAEVAAERSQAMHLPMVDLTLWPAPRPGAFVMHGMHTPAARVEKLVALAKARGAKRLAVLYPQSAYGKKMRERLLPAAEAQGLAIAIEVPYESRATSFAGPLRSLAAADFDTLFIPDGASKLELIGPALAAADLWSSASLATVPKQGRAILVLSTAENLSSKIVRESRYLQGVLLSPGYYVEPGPFADGYHAEHGEDPSLFAAAAYDVVRLARHVLETGVASRDQMATSLVKATGVWGVQGEVRLSASGGTRIDEPPIYTIAGQTVERVGAPARLY